MFHRNGSMLAAMVKAPIVATTLSGCHTVGAYSAMRRGMPARPSRCIGKNVSWRPTNMSVKWTLPSRSSSIRPSILGNQ